MTIRLRGLAWATAGLAAGLLPGAPAGAQTLQYRIDASVNLTTPGTAGFPAELAGLVVGSPVSLLIEFDRGATVATPSVLGLPYSDATYYTMASARVTLLGGTAPIDLSHGTEGLWVWNDDLIFSGVVQDGLAMQNSAAIGSLGYAVLSGIMPTTRWTDEAVPEAGISLPLQLGLNRLGESGIFFRAGGSRLQVSVVPEPATWAMGLAGGLLLGAAVRARRREGPQPMSPPR